MSGTKIFIILSGGVVFTCDRKRSKLCGCNWQGLISVSLNRNWLINSYDALMQSTGQLYRLLAWVRSLGASRLVFGSTGISPLHQVLSLCSKLCTPTPSSSVAGAASATEHGKCTRKTKYATISKKPTTTVNLMWTQTDFLNSKMTLYRKHWKILSASFVF